MLHKLKEKIVEQEKKDSRGERFRVFSKRDYARILREELIGTDLLHPLYGKDGILAIRMLTYKVFKVSDALNVFYKRSDGYQGYEHYTRFTGQRFFYTIDDARSYIVEHIELSLSDCVKNKKYLTDRIIKLRDARCKPILPNWEATK